MPDPQIHFEVHGKKAASWTVQRVCDDQSVAIDSAKNMFRDLGLKAVKVLKVSFDQSNPAFQDKEVYFEGEKAEVSSAATVELIEPICRTAQDLYSSESRRAILKLLSKPLEAWKITPLELLYHQGHLQKLNDTGQILQGAVQRVAISQVPKTGQNVSERVRELYALTSEVLQDLKATTVQEDIPVVEQDDLLGLVRAAKETEDWRKTFMMSMARYLQDKKSIYEKFETILGFLTKYDDPELLQFLDQYLADFLVSSEMLKALLGEEENLGNAVLTLIDFLRGAKENTAGTSKDTHRINALLRDQALPQTRRTLVHKLNETLAGNKSFVKDDPVKSIPFHSLIFTRLRISDNENIGGQKALDSLYARSERMTGSSTIAMLLEGYELPLDRVEQLLKVNEGIIGSAGKRTIANYILPVLESAFNQKLIVESSDPVLATIARLKSLQLRVSKSDFQQYYRDKISEALDAIGVEVMTSNEVLAKLSKEAEDNFQLGLTLLQMLSAEKLTEPAVLEMVRDFARKTIVSGTFMQELESKAKKGSSQAELFKQFYMLLEKAGIK